jgi:hypothetical protein
MRRTAPEGTTEYPVNPEQIAAALATRIRFETGILNSNTICVISEGIQRTVVEYRPPQKTRLHVEGTGKPFNVPLPGLVLIRQTSGDANPQYAVFAVKQRPISMKAELYQAVLPNIYDAGGICWGGVRKASKVSLSSSVLDEDWALLLGTAFNNHSVHGKSKSHPRDIRQKYMEMEQRKTRKYPITDLIPAKKTLGSVLGVKDDE